MSNIKHYSLSLQADEDLQDIYDYTEEYFGTKQAVKYVSEFEAVFQRLIQNPKIGRDRIEIREGLRSYNKGRHVIFYRIQKDHIRIVRLLHDRKDLKNFDAE